MKTKRRYHIPASRDQMIAGMVKILSDKCGDEVAAMKLMNRWWDVALDEWEGVAAMRAKGRAQDTLRLKEQLAFERSLEGSQARADKIRALKIKLMRCHPDTNPDADLELFHRLTREVKKLRADMRRYERQPA